MTDLRQLEALVGELGNRADQHDAAADRADDNGEHVGVATYSRGLAAGLRSAAEAVAEAAEHIIRESEEGHGLSEGSADDEGSESRSRIEQINAKAPLAQPDPEVQPGQRPGDSDVAADDPAIHFLAPAPESEGSGGQVTERFTICSDCGWNLGVAHVWMGFIPPEEPLPVDAECPACGEPMIECEPVPADEGEGHDKTCGSCGGQGCQACDYTGHVPAPCPTCGGIYPGPWVFASETTFIPGYTEKQALGAIKPLHRCPDTFHDAAPATG